MLSKPTSGTFVVLKASLYTEEKDKAQAERGHIKQGTNVFEV